MGHTMTRTLSRASLLAFLSLPHALSAAPSVPTLAPAAGAAAPIRVLLVPEREAVLAANMTGRIIALPVALGGAFAAGQALVRFDCNEHAARLKIADTEIAAARETLDSRQQLQQYRSVSELDVRLAQSSLEKTLAQANLIRVQMGYCSVAAPFSGRVVKIRAKLHETVTQGQPLLEIVDNSAMRFQLHIPSRWLVKLSAGSKFTVHIDETGKSYPAKIRVINGRIDPGSQTVEITANIEGKFNELIAGMSGSAEFDGM